MKIYREHIKVCGYLHDLAEIIPPMTDKMTNIDAIKECLDTLEKLDAHAKKLKDLIEQQQQDAQK